MQKLNRSDEERLLDSVNTLLNLFLVDETQFAPAEGRVKYNPVDFQCLRYIDDHPGTKAIDISQSLHIAPTTLQSALDRMVKQGLMERSRHAEDGRARAYHLTEAGQDVRDAIHRQDIANMGAMLSAVEADKRNVVLEQLERVATVLKAGGD